MNDEEIIRATAKWIGKEKKNCCSWEDGLRHALKLKEDALVGLDANHTNSVPQKQVQHDVKIKRNKK